MSKITYTDKETLTTLPEIAEINKFRAEDANEIKFSVNELYDNADIATLENETGWIDISDSNPVYSTWDNTNKLGTITIDNNYTSIISKDTKVKLEQLDSLTSYWSLDGNSIDTVNAYNGTDTDIVYNTGKFGQCATFNGTTSKIIIADNSALKPKNTFTLGCWINTTNTVTQCVFQSYSSTASIISGFRLRISDAGLAQLIISNNAGLVEEQNYTLINSFSTVNDGNWHYIVVTYELGEVKLFIDGVLENLKKTVNLDYAITNYIRIGCGNNLGTDFEFFNGSIDDIYFINGYVKSNEDIKAKYDLDTAQTNATTVVEKRFNLYSVTLTNMVLSACKNCTLSNSAISSLKYSNVETPYDFPIKKESVAVSVTEPQGAGRCTNWFQKGKNLFDKNNVNKLNASIDASGIIQTSILSKTMYIPCKSNTQYTVSRIAGQRFAVGVSTTIPVIGTTCTSFIRNDTATSITITSGNLDMYLIVHYYASDVDSSEQQILDSIQIEQNAIATTYESYINPTMWILNNNDVYEKFMEKEQQKYINSGTVFSTNDYIDGKRVYGKRINVGILPNAATKSVAHGLTGVTFIKLEGMFTNGTLYFSPNTTDPSSLTIQIKTYISTSNVELVTGIDRTSYSGYVTLYFTYN